MIGTTEIQLKRIRNNNLKLTNLTKVQEEKKKTNIFLKILEIIGVGILAAGLAALGQEWATAGLISLGLSEGTIALTGTVIGASIEFGVMEGYDALTGNVNATNTALNALPFLKVGKMIPQSIKLNKLFTLAEETGVFKELNFADNEIKSFYQITKMLEGKNINLNHTIYNFTNKKNAKAVFYKLLSDYSYKKGLSLGSKNLKLGIAFEKNGVDDILELQRLLQEISPEYFPNINKKFYNQAKQIIEDNNFTKKDFLDSNKFGELVLNARTLKGNKSASLVWALYSMKQTIEIENTIFKKILNNISKINEILSKVDPIYWLKKIIDKTFKFIEPKIMKIIKKTKITKPINYIEKKYQEIVNKINDGYKKTFKKTDKEMLEEYDKILIPVNSKWILGYKFKKVFKNYVVSIYFKDTKYEPRIFHWKLKDFERWIKACSDNKAGEFYKRYLELGYHLKTSGYIGIVNFMPPIISGFIKEAMNTYKEYKRMKKLYSDIKDEKMVGNTQKELINYLKNKTILWSSSLIFTSTLFKTIFNNFVNEKDNIKYFKNNLTNNLIKNAYKKIPSIERVR